MRYENTDKKTREVFNLICPTGNIRTPGLDIDFMYQVFFFCKY